MCQVIVFAIWTDIRELVGDSSSVVTQLWLGESQTNRELFLYSVPNTHGQGGDPQGIKTVGFSFLWVFS